MSLLKTAKRPVKWVGSPPDVCDTCDKPITSTFVDGATIMGPWGNMCLGCHRKFGVGLGTGKGQLFRKQPDGSFLKTEG